MLSEVVLVQAFDALSKRILSENQQDAFFVCDLSEVKSLFEEWRATLPAVWPFYAVKCNPDVRVVSALAECGAGFDCATLSEMQLVLGLGVAPSRIIFANPCKMESHLLFAKENNVRRMTVDSVEEVEKIHSHFPMAELVVRIATDDGESNFKLSNKFGASPSLVPRILESAQRKCLDVVGVSFHVGSECGNLMAYKKAIYDAERAFAMARKLGFNPTLLDIGGGFNGRNSESKASLQTIAATIHESLAEWFSKYEDLQVISEPGRYFVASVFTLSAQIYSKRKVNETSEMMYYLNEGIYGCLNGTLYGEEPPQFQLFRKAGAKLDPIPLENTFTSYVWGPTLDGLDLVYDEIHLPELHNGDWFVFPNMGAYCLSLCTSFNGYPCSKVYYINE